MNEIKRIRRCPGCGVILQTLDESLPGYVPEKHIERHEVIICQRCFKLQHYGEDISNGQPHVNEDFLKILKRAKDENALIIYVVDLFAFNSSISPEINKIIKGMDIIGVANKRDLLPKSVNENKLRDYVIDHCNKANLIFNELIIASPLKNYRIDDLKQLIQKWRKGRNVYVIGATSSGKSTLVNTYIRNYTNTTNSMITTSPFPGTTLRIIEIPLDNSSFLYDTPGYVIDNSLISIVEKDVLKSIVPREVIKPRTYQLFAKQSIIMGGLARFDYLKGRLTGFTFYISPRVQLRRSQLIYADHSFNNMIEKRKIHPVSKRINNLQDLEAFEITIEEEGRVDVGIAGLGWINFQGNKQTIRVLAPKGVHIYIETPKI
jgi:30S ribosome assembly GTPase